MTSKTTQAPTVVVTGANRGLGLEFARQYAADGWRVYATARRPDNAKELGALAAQNAKVTVERLELSEIESIKSLAQKLKGQPVDLLLHNAAVLGDLKKQTYGSLDGAEFQYAMSVNVFGVLALSEALRENLLASSQKKIVGITSGAGILSQRSFGGIPFYSISKTALNKALQCLAAELSPKGAVVGILAPGVADTEMRRSLVGELAAKDNRPEVAVAKMREVIGRMTQENTNVVWNFDGTELPW